jgi:hypothetical protein
MLTRRIVLAGLVASLVMGMFQMVYEAIAGAGLWAPPTLIAATLIRSLQATTLPIGFQPLPVVLGLMGHMMNSIILGALFVLFIAPRLTSRGALATAGAMYGLAIFVIMRLIVVPLVDPALSTVSWPAFAMAHVMWGVAIGLVLGWRSRTDTVLAPAHAV